MPVTFLFSCLGLLGLLLFVPAVPTSIALLAAKRKLPALVILCIPGAIIVLSVGLTAMVFAGARLHSLGMSARPNHLFRATFGFKPPPQTTVIEAHHETIMDYGTTVMRFQTAPDVMERIVARGFTACDRESFVREYRGNGHNLPQRIQSWFPPAVEQAHRFYIAETFDRSFGCSRAILCYDEDARIAYFHWVGID